VQRCGADRHHDWIGGEIKSKPGSFDYADPQSFEDSLIRSLAAALAKINGAGVSTRL